MRRLVLTACAAALAAALPLLPAGAADSNTGALDTAYGAQGVRPLPLAGRILSGTVLAHQGRQTVVASTWARPDPTADVDDSGVVVQRLSARGDVDRSFGTQGRRVLDLPEPASLTDLAVLPDGDLVLLVLFPSTRSDVSQRFGLLRLLRNGDRDASFGTRGLVMGSGGLQDATPAALVPTADGGVLVGLTDGDPDSDLLVASYDASGTLQPSYGVGGVARIDAGGAERLRDLLPAAGGAVVAVGTTARSGQERVVLGKLTPAGRPDTTFGTGGTTAFSVGGQVVNVTEAALAGRSLVVAGQLGTGPATYSSFVAGLTASGQLRPAFGSNGLLHLDEPGFDAAVRPLLTGRGTLLFGQRLGDSAHDGRLWEVDATTGAPVKTFGSGGAVELGSAEVSDLVNDSAGVLLALLPSSGSGPRPPGVQRRL